MFFFTKKVHIVMYVTPHVMIYSLMNALLYSMAGKHWIKAMVLTASLFPFLCFSIGFALNTIAIFYRSLAAIPFGTMVVMLVLWAFISFPLVLLGTVVGRNWSGAPNNPCRVKTIPRPIPEKKWYLTPSVISLMGGLLPFGSIFIEMYFVFTSFWNYKVNMEMFITIFLLLIKMFSLLLSSSYKQEVHIICF
jgi:transmembrane 9 superfamily member 3